MSIKIMNAVWQSAPVDGRRLLLLLALADNCDDDGVCFPSIAYLAKKTRQSRRNVQYSLKFLQTENLMSIVVDDYGFNHYHLNLDLICANFAPPRVQDQTEVYQPLHGGVQGRAKNIPALAPKPSITINESSQPKSTAGGEAPLLRDDEPELVAKRKKPTEIVDARKAAIRDAIKKGYAWKNANRECPWGPAEEQALSRVLNDVPKSYTAEFFVQCVRHRFLSADTHSAAPRSWLKILLTYAEGPLDRFGKPKTLAAQGNANGKSDEKQKQRIDDARDILEERRRARSSSYDADRSVGDALPHEAGTRREGALPEGVDPHRGRTRAAAAAASSHVVDAHAGQQLFPEPEPSTRDDRAAERPARAAPVR